MTKIVGILNVTPDSFSDGGYWNSPERAEERVATLFSDGADMIDIGAESTKPGVKPVTPEQEWQRLEPVLCRLKDQYDPSMFSIDTRHGEIASRAVDTWSKDLMINDVTMFNDPKMVEVVAAHGLRAVVSHLPPIAKGDLDLAHKEKINSEGEVLNDLLDRISELEELGVKRDKMIIDPGIGFGKTPELNRKLVSFARLTTMPVMIGYSRKRFLGEFHRFAAAPNIELGRIAVVSGAAYLRVHDVAAHRHMLNDTE